jgi:amidase
MAVREDAVPKTYLFSVGPSTPPTQTIEPGAKVELVVEGAFVDVKDIKAVPVPFTPACDGHPLAPIAGPIRVRGAEPGDSLAVTLEAIRPVGIGCNAIMRNFGVLSREFAEPAIVDCPVRDGKAWFGGRVAIPLNPNLGTLSTMPPEGYKPSYAGVYGGDFDQRDVGIGATVHLPVMVPGALLFMADPHAAISDGIVSGTGVECTAEVEARIDLVKRSSIDRPLIDFADTVQILGFGPSVEAATADATMAAVGFVAAHTGLHRQEAYMLLGIVGDLRIGTSPRPIMAARLIVPKEVLRSAGWDGRVAVGH